MAKKKFIALAVAAAAALLIYYFWGQLRDGDGTIRTSGHIEVTEADLSFRLPGHVARISVQEGSPVRKGDTAAELKTSLLELQKRQASAKVRELEARTASLELAVEIKRETAEAAVEQSSAGVSAAEARYLTLKRGSRQEEIRQAEAVREQARTEMEKRRLDFERMNQLYQRKVIAKSEFDAVAAAFEAAKSSLAAAEETYKLVKAGPRREAVSEGKANLSGSKSVLSASRAALREVDRLEMELEASRAQLEQARTSLAAAEDDLRESRLLAPFDGFVTVKNVEEGEFVQAGTPVVTIAELDRVWVKTYVPETQLGRVGLGRKAVVFSDTYPGKEYPGEVTFISPEAEFTPKNVQTREERVKLVYRIKVSLENPGQELKPGMPVDVVLQ